MGLIDEAKKTLQSLRRDTLQASDRRAASLLWEELGEYRRSHRMAPIPWEGGLPDFPDQDSLVDVQLAYPRAYQQHVEGPTRAPSVEPEFLFALMRAESGFYPQARSPAYALGLTQMVSRTAYNTARSIGLKGFRFWKLCQPKISIKLGSSHLADLQKRLDHHPALVLAAYNAGEPAVMRWVKRRGDLALDIFIEEIPYTETNRYVRKVLSFYAIYKALLDPQNDCPLNIPFYFSKKIKDKAKRL
jgi:soluble lytic murein transglycosylase